MSFSEALVCSGVSGRSSTISNSVLLACNRFSRRSSVTKPVRRRKMRSKCLRNATARRGLGLSPGSFGSLAENRVDCGLAVFGEVFESFDRLETKAAKERQRGVANGRQRLRGVAGVGSRLIF